MHMCLPARGGAISPKSLFLSLLMPLKRFALSDFDNNKTIAKDLAAGR